MEDDQSLYVGYFADFREPTVLFWGSATGLCRLAKFLGCLGGQDTEVLLTDQSWIQAIGGIRLWVEISDPESGMRQRRRGSPPEFRWRLTAETARRFAELTRPVGESVRPCHQYLDTDCIDEVEVVVSKGEYDGLEHRVD